MTRTAIALLLLAAPALADETWDLRKLIARKSPVGEKVRVVEQERSTTAGILAQVGAEPQVEEQKVDISSASVDEVLAVDADGTPTRVRRVYASFTSEGKDVPVAGLVVIYTRGEGPKGRHAYAVEEGSAPLPDAVKAALDKDIAESNGQVAKGVTEDAVNSALFPEAPQAAGASWDVDMKRALVAFGLDAGETDMAESAGMGTIEAVEEREGRRWLKGRVALKIVVTKLQGNQLSEPATMDYKYGFVIPLDGGVGLEASASQHLAAVMKHPQDPTATYTMRHDSEQLERRSVP